MPARITCPHCRRDLRLPDELYDVPAQCPLCKGAFGIHWRMSARQRPAAADAEPLEVLAVPELRPCRACGEQIKASARRCPHCGVYQGTD